MPKWKNINIPIWVYSVAAVFVDTAVLQAQVSRYGSGWTLPTHAVTLRCPQNTAATL